MNRLSLYALAGVAALTAGGAAADDLAPGPDGVACEIRASGTASRVRLAGTAIALAAASGRYAFTLHKEGRSGSSDISQSGDFRLAPGEPGVLNQVDVALAAGDAYRATMTVSWQGRTVSCQKTGSGPSSAI
ncbi:MAG: curli-like amyloid fiber formation chaperone CsgH [Bauldia sp.]